MATRISFPRILYPQLLPLQGCPVTDPKVKFSLFLDFLSDLKKKQNKKHLTSSKAKQMWGDP